MPTTYLSSAIRGYVSSYLGLPIACWQGIILNFIESTLIGIYYFFPIYFVNEFHINIATAGVIMSFYGLGAIIGGLLGGFLSDKISSRIVSSACLLILSAIFFILTKLHIIKLLIIALFILGIASYGFITSNYLWVLAQCDNHEIKRLKAINLLSVASNLGLGLSAIIVSLMASYGFKNILILSSTLLFLSAIYFYLIERHSISPTMQNHHTMENVTTLPTDKIKNKKIIYLVLGCLFLTGLIVFQSSTTYSIYIQKSFPDLGLKGISFLFTLNSFLVVFFQAPIINLLSKQNKILIIGMGAFLLGFGRFILSFAFVFSLAILSCLVYTLGEILFFSVAQFVCYQNGLENKKGYTLGTYRMVYASSRVLGPAVGGHIYQQCGANMVWFACGLLGLLCLTGCYGYKIQSAN